MYLNLITIETADSSITTMVIWQSNLVIEGFY